MASPGEKKNIEYDTFSDDPSTALKSQRMAPQVIIAVPKKNKPRKQVRLKRRLLAEASAGAGSEAEDEDVKAAREHKARQKPKAVEKLDEQEKPVKKRKRDDRPAKDAGGEKSAAGEKKPRLPKNKRAKAKAQEEEEVGDTAVEEVGEGEERAVEKKEARFIAFVGKSNTNIIRA